MTGFGNELVALRPRLMSMAYALAGTNGAEDLTQHTLLRAWQFRDRFTPGTNLMAWAGTIMRREHYKECRRIKVHNPVPLDALDGASQPHVPADQEAHVLLAETAERIGSMPAMYRDVLLLAATGATDREMVEATLATRNTVATRVLRGRRQLSRAMA